MRFWRGGGGIEVGLGIATAGLVGAGEFGSEVAFVGGGGDGDGVADEFEKRVAGVGRKFVSQDVAVAQEFGAGF